MPRGSVERLSGVSYYEFGAFQFNPATFVLTRSGIALHAERRAVAQNMSLGGGGGNTSMVIAIIAVVCVIGAIVGLIILTTVR